MQNNTPNSVSAVSCVLIIGREVIGVLRLTQ